MSQQGFIFRGNKAIQLALAGNFQLEAVLSSQMRLEHMETIGQPWCKIGEEIKGPGASIMVSVYFQLSILAPKFGYSVLLMLVKV